MIFFMSDSNMADSPAINMVRDAERRSNVWKCCVWERDG